MHQGDPPVTYGRVLRTWQADWFSITESVHGAGQRLRLHAHRNPDLTIVRSGFFETGRPDLRHECGPMQVLFLPGGYEHSDRFGPAPTHSFIIEIRRPRWESLGRRCRVPQTSCLFDSPLQRHTAAALTNTLVRPAMAGVRAVEDWVVELLGAVVRHDEARGNIGRPRWLAETIELLRCSFRTGISLSLLADRAGVHPIHLARVFRTHLGCSVGEYVLRLRMEEAARALTATEKAICRIAIECGFYDQAQFSRMFKRATGITPTTYRVQRGGQFRPGSAP